jgi:hypothetical protein
MGGDEGVAAAQFQRIVIGMWQVKASDVPGIKTGMTVGIILEPHGLLVRPPGAADIVVDYRDTYAHGASRRDIRLTLRGANLDVRTMSDADPKRIEQIILERRSADARTAAGLLDARFPKGLILAADGSVSFWGVVLAASQFGLTQGSRCFVRFAADGVLVTAGANAPTIPYRTVSTLRVGGRGMLTERSGGGFIGGGFGLTGAIEGIALASALNALTTRTTTSVETIVEFAAGPKALLLLTSDEPPDLLRTHLAAPLAWVEAAHRPERAEAAEPTASPAMDRLSQLKLLGELRDSAVLSPEEFEVEKARVLGS